MQIVIPMSGAGSRFANAGYREPKPLVKIDGRCMIEHVISMFPGETDFVFVCARPHLEMTPLESVLRHAAPSARIVSLESHKLGPVYAVLCAEEFISNEEPVIVNYCDFAVYWDYRDFTHTVTALGCEGALTAYRGFHPHSLGPNLYAYLTHNENRLVEIREKQSFTSNRMEEYASSGTYYFRSGKLLKEYYRRAIQNRLSTNGEYYASMPHNLMVQDGLHVHVYEIEHFLQWGTPEDLREYTGWSDYFSNWEAWRPVTPFQGSVVIPMAGEGARFRAANYIQPKPLVPVAGVAMVERAARTLPESDSTIVLCRNEIQLRDLRPNSVIVSLPDRTEGQACTCLAAEPFIDPLKPVLVASCDCSLIYDEAAFRQSTQLADCVAFTFRDHPHANRNPQQYSWICTGKSDSVRAVLCKTPPGNVCGAQGLTGVFWFRQARMLFDAVRRLIFSGRRIHGEFYLDSALEILIEAGQRVRALEVRRYVCFGTPDDVRTYEYWDAFFRKCSWHPFGKDTDEARCSEAFHSAPVL